MCLTLSGKYVTFEYYDFFFCSASFVTSLLALKSRNLEFDSQEGNEVSAFFKNILNDCEVHADSYSVAI